jgi:hypothetical protein
MKGRELTTHEVSSKLILITSGYAGYKERLHHALSLVLVAEDGAWRWQAFSSQEREYKYTTFRDYLKRWSQFGIEDLKRLFTDDAQILTLLEKADTGQHGGDRKSEYFKSSNTTLDNPDRGKAYTLRRLEKDAPSLFQKVLNNELSANAAAIVAGFRKKPSPYDQLVKAWEKASDQEREEFLSLIQQDL